MAPVRYKCERVEIFPATESKPALVLDDCEWQVDDGVRAITLDCAKGGNRYVVSRNMDDARDKYPWRISRFDLDSGEPIGHTYGKDAADTLNKHVSRHEKCVVTKVRTQDGRDDFGALAKLTTTSTSSAASKEALRVVGAFLRGETARGACKGKAEDRTCAIVSDGKTLKVSGTAVATREGERMSVCVPPDTVLEKKGRSRRESEEAKDVRVAASAILRSVAGVGIRNSPEGQRLLTARGRASMLFPAGCAQVRISKRDVAKLLATAAATEAAKARFKTEYPSQAQVAKARAAILAAQRMTALTKAQAVRRAQMPGEAPFPEEEFAPEVLPPEAPLPEAPSYPEPEEAPYEDETFQWDVPPALPTDVRYPTDPGDYTRFVNEYLPRLRKGLKRDAALAWQAYLLDPTRRRPGAGEGMMAAPEKVKRAAREVELELANEYGIVDPNHGFEPPDVARRSAQEAAAAKRRRESGEKPTGVQSTDRGLRVRAAAQREELLARTNAEAWARLRRSRG